MAWTGWNAAVTALLPLSGGERRVLQPAASFPVSLRDTIPGLDPLTEPQTRDRSYPAHSRTAASAPLTASQHQPSRPRRPGGA